MENKNSNLSKAERLEILAMKIHEFIYNGSTYSLKDRFLNNKLSTSERLTKQDLKLLEEFLSDIDKLGGSNEELIKKWVLPNKPDGYFDQIKDAIFGIDRTELKNLIEFAKQQNKVSSSLLPIKGISQTMQGKLKLYHIYDIPSLLQKGKTQSKRNYLASKLDIDVKLVNSWVKQADLWRVEGMTPDTAFLLVQIGVRNVKDLARVDVYKAYPIMQRLCFTQIDFLLENQNTIEAIIKNAEELVDSSFMGRQLLLTIETNEPEPEYLFRQPSNYQIDELLKTSGEIIREGMDALDDVIPALPLPHIIRGQIYMRKTGEPQLNDYPFANAKVEISGISSASSDPSEAGKKPFGYTDGGGNFSIIMPDRYNFQETVAITVTKGANKQTFFKTASDIINSVKEQKVLDLFNKLDFIKGILDAEKEKKDIYERLKKYLATNPNNVAEIKAEIKKWEIMMPEIESEIKLQTQTCIDTEKEIRQTIDDHTVVSLNRILKNLVSRNNLEADLGVFVLTDEIFKGLSSGLKKTLPSVKLMENDNEAVRLTTDTAPARVFNYCMLQRLVEPAITNGNKDGDPTIRTKLTKPVDVMAFKENIYNAPDSIIKMSSLGIGYILNMHQAWVPDGFALGSLLYSLVLAPGEEQRLVVREKSQTYTVSDNSDASDSTRESYTLTQDDDAMAVYNYALNQLSKADYQSEYSTKTSSHGGGLGIGGVFGGFSAMLGLSGSTSKSSGSASSSASQSNAHNEVSSAAQNFQHSIKSASERVAQAKRISVRAATSAESDSVATKIIANHNHSHTLTIQYWEVMRRYRMETCIDGVELVLFVPLEIISFKDKNEDFVSTSSNSTDSGSETSQKTDKDKFNERYKSLLKYADILLPHLPYKYKNGLELIKRYAAYPYWEREKEESSSSKELKLSFNCNILEFDDINATLVLKNGKGIITGTSDYERDDLVPKVENEGTNNENKIETSLQLKQKIKERRNEEGDVCTFSFNIPGYVTESDIDYIRLDHSYESFSYNLYQRKKEELPEAQQKALTNLENYEEWLAQDNKKSDTDRINIAHYKSLLPEAFTTPIVTLSPSVLRSYGSPRISNVVLSFGEGDNKSKRLMGVASSSTINPSLRINVQMSCRVLRNSEWQEMESTFQHIVADTLHYSQVVWGSLSDDERAMMLEGYTIDMDFSNLKGYEDIYQVEIDQDNYYQSNNRTGQYDPETETIDIPLLNCVNIKKPLGFYGNCILLPFTYPQSLAKKLNKTAAEVQDALYRYHTACYRVPSTTISLPTDGMIGEAVLGETNVSEVIDLTRFWNWKDSPIDKMDIGKDYLNNTDYLDGKAPAGTTALNIQSATAPQPATVTDLISALAGKQTPQFTDFAEGLQQLKEILNEGTKSAASGRDKILDNSNAMMGKVIDLLKLKPELDKSSNSEADKDNKPETGKPSTSGGAGTTTGGKPEIETGGKGEADKDSKPETGKPSTSGGSGTTTGGKPETGTGGKGEADKDSKPEAGKHSTSGEAGTTTGGKPETGTGGSSETGKDSKPETGKTPTLGEAGTIGVDKMTNWNKK